MDKITPGSGALIAPLGAETWTGLTVVVTGVQSGAGAEFELGFTHFFLNNTFLFYVIRTPLTSTSAEVLSTLFMFTLYLFPFITKSYSFMGL